MSRRWVKESELDKDALAQLNADLLAQYKASPTPQLRNRIATANHRLALHVAHREKARRKLDVEDLEQLASIGLIKAIEKYDPARGAAFSSFAVPYIRGEIMHWCRDNDTTIKVPRIWREQADAARKAQAELLTQGREVELITIALSMGISESRWREIEAATTNHKITSLDNDEALEIAADTMENTEDIESAVAHGLSLLPEQQRDCIVEKFWGELSEKMIAIRHGLTLAEVTELIRDGLTKLKTV
ncbi:MAG: sigma-70 family RNA polymerase sigma factor [Cyanobacteria bacterium P01_D01_bin.36]